MTSAVTMATYNGVRHLYDQFRSIAAQTERPDQLIVSDDCSTDGTLDVVRRVAPTIASTYTVIAEGRRLGPVGNFQRAFERVDADIVFLCDQDDLWMPEKVATIMSHFRADPDLGGVFSDGSILSNEKSNERQSLWQLAGFSPREQSRWKTDPLAVLLRRNVVTGGTLAVRTNQLRSFLPLPSAGWHDLSLAVLLVTTSKLKALPFPLISYRLHQANAAGLPSGNRRSRVVDRATHMTNLDSQSRHWAELRSRVAALGTDPATLRRIDAKLRHLAVRRGLPVHRTSRVRPAAREGLRGGYREYANGPWSLVRDVLGP